MPALPWIIGLLGAGGAGGFIAGGGISSLSHMVKWAAIGFISYEAARYFKVF